MATKEEIKQNIRDDLNGLPGWDLTSPYQRITPLIDSIVDEIYDNVDAKENIISFYNPTSGLPADPELFDRYVASATGNGWTQRYIYEWDGTQWIQTIPEEGFLAWVENEDMFYVFNGTNWINLLSTSGFEPAITPGTIYQVFFGDKVFRDLTTTVVPEGTNLYYTNVRVAAYGDTRYSQLGHNHNDLYSQLGHSHDYSSIYAPINHNHTGVYAGVIHSHTHSDITDFASYTQTVCDALYSPLGHIHDTRYSLLNHAHTGVYEPVITRGTTAQYFRGDLTLATMPTSMPSPHTLTLGTGLTGSSYNGSAAVTAAVSYGSTAGTACQGNDSRLSDARYPLAHTHDERYYTETESDARYSQLGQVYTGLTSGYIPYYNGSTFANSPLSVSGSNVTSSGYLFGTTSLRSGTSTTGVLEITPYLFGYGVNYKSFTISHDGTLLLDSSKIGNSFDSYWTGIFHATSFIRGAYTVWDAGNLTGDQTGHYHSADRTAVYSVLTSGYVPYYNGSAFANSFLSQVNSQVCSSNNINLGNQNDPSTDQGNTWITWGYRSDNSPYYAIRTDRHVYNIENQNRLQIGWHTGVEIGASSTYGGTRFFNSSPFVGTQIMSIGDGDNHVRVSNSLYVNTNVGIGTTTLTERLNVAGSIYASASVYAGYGCYAYNNTEFGTFIGVFKYQGALPGYSTRYFPVLKTDYDTLYFSAAGKYSGHIGGADAELGLLNTSGEVKVSINTNGNSFLMGGNVGVNITSPTYKLHVDGSFYATSMSRSGYTVWDSGNDGNGSGLDSDTLDTYHGSNYLGKNGNTHYQADAWVQFSGTQGLYFPNSASCTNLYPITDNYTYGSLLIEGGKGNWQGISFYSPLRPDNLPTFMINNNSYNHGMHVQGASPHQWLWYWDDSVKNILIQGESAKFVWHAGNLTGTRNEHTHTNISNADTVDSLHSYQFFNNMGSVYTTYPSFSSIPNFGNYFVQASVDGPIATQNQYYTMSMGLGNDHGYSEYGSQMCWKRGSASYLYMRFREAGTWGNWYKVGAGYADDATHAYNSDALSNVTLGNATANRLVRYNSTATQFVSSLIVDDGTNLGMYSTGYAAMTAGANIGIYADVNEGGIGFVGDVVTNLTMANGTSATLHNAKIDYGNYNEITGLYHEITTVNVSSYTTSHFLINAQGGSYFKFVGAKMGSTIFVSNNNNGTESLIYTQTNDDNSKYPISSKQTFLMFCEYTDNSTVWVWRPFNSLPTGF